MISLLLISCGKNPSENQLESLIAVETALRMNVDNPDEMFRALDACIEQYRPVWQTMGHLHESRSEDSIKKEQGLQEAKIRDVMLRIVDLDLEIQDRYLSQPEILKAYHERISKIGFTNNP